MKKRLLISISIVSVLVLTTISLFYFIPSKTITMGFIADLTGRQSQLGISVRNGFLMAVNELNESGGINGKTITPIIKNNENDLDICLTRTIEMVEEEVDVIIGPLTSAMVIPVLKGSGDTLVISPTVSTDRVTAIDDMFFRVIPAASMQGRKMADVVIANKEENIVIILDERNIEYSGAFTKGFIDIYTDNTGLDPTVISFNDKAQFSPIIDQLININPDAILFISSGVDSAGIIQQYAKITELPQLYSSYWGKASNIHEYGGKIVEGMIIVTGYENEVKSKRELDFTEKYKDLYEINPNFAAQFSYETVMLYAQAVLNGNSTNPEKVKTEILNLDQFEGITDSYRLDDFGDVIREQTLFIIRNNLYEFY